MESHAALLAAGVIEALYLSTRPWCWWVANLSTGTPLCEASKTMQLLTDPRLCRTTRKLSGSRGASVLGWSFKSNRSMLRIC